ncbi:helix-turn-helix transcriptional regulator [Maribellus mangrovi]|uniref:helix-turn-helix transcriptional regulator n=1 Tax=Maribellus mangrovi TaxID=3133146 RepID=UPI0030EBEC1B
MQYCEQLDEYDVKTEVLKLLTSVNERLGNTKAALQYSKDYALSLDSLRERSSGAEILKIKAKHELDTELLQTRNELELVQLEKERRELIIAVIGIVALAIILTMLLLYLLQRTRHKRLKSEQELHRVEKEKVAEELEFRKKEMTANGMYLAQKNNLILLVNQRLKELLPVLPKENAREIKNIISELDNKTHDNSWEEFEKRFKEVHTDFYERLSKAYPKLTAGDLRLCGFLRLNMSNKEIAAITYQNVESLKTARYRLRKKLGLSREVNLIHFLTKF